MQKLLCFGTTYADEIDPWDACTLHGSINTVATAAYYTMVSITFVNFIIILAPWPYFAHLETFLQIYVFKACLEILQSVAKGHTEGLLV